MSGAAPILPQADLQQADAWLAQGRADLALPVLAQWVAAEPGNPAAHNQLGLALLQLERAAESLEHFEQALAFSPATPAYRLHRGYARHALGRDAEAMGDYQAYANAVPQDPAPWVNIAGLHLQTGDAPVAAEEAARRALALRPGHPHAWTYLGQALYQQGRFPEAESTLRGLLQRHPELPDALHNLGDVLRALDRGAESEPLYRQALQLNPALPVTWCNLGNYHISVGRNAEARQAYEKALALDPLQPEASANLCSLLVELGQEAEAVERLQGYQRQGLRTPQHCAILAYALRVCERLEEAAAVLREAPASPDRILAQAWAKLGDAHAKYRNEAIRRVTAWLDGPGRAAPTPERSAMTLTLAQLLDQSGQHPRAFAAALAAKRLQRERADRGADQALLRATQGAFSAPRLRRPPLGLQGEERPLFIVGMPRSGTSLVEQILAAHPQVHAGGEVKEIGFISDELAGTRPTGWPERAATLDAAALTALAERWLYPLAQLAPEARRITDKMPHNFEKLGLIALLFPGARVIHVRRDPRDTCLSIFFHSFTGYHPYANDLEDLARHYVYYERLMAHWRRVLPLPLLEVRYEELTADPEAQTRRLLDFAGLPWDAAVLRYHESRRAVLTASRFQVREPVHRRQVGRWRRYARELQPLTRILREQGVLSD